MICFLTSRPDPPDSDHLSLNEANRFREELLRVLPRPCRVLNICSDQEAHEITDYYAGFMKKSLENAGARLSDFRVLDGRNEAQAAELVRSADLLILSGGHVPTQNRFFRKIGLKALLRDFDGVLLGISAGTMNCAELVYAQPEEAGEAVDPGYRRFLPGLGLTKRMILPHYQEIKDELLDGLRVMEEIAYPDSVGRQFLLFPDGTYLYLENGNEEIRGEAFFLADGKLSRVAAAKP